jgi:hypothetical protein
MTQPVNKSTSLFDESPAGKGNLALQKLNIGTGKRFGKTLNFCANEIALEIKRNVRIWVTMYSPQRNGASRHLQPECISALTGEIIAWYCTPDGHAGSHPMH